ncbi:MAG: crossover junction endodeoxyribonuclease RuvC, partial [Candidatus Jacksonbacteria bacterium]
GIDPGLATTGFGIIKVQNQQFTHIVHGVIQTLSSQPHYHRLLKLSRQLKKVIKKYQPQTIAVEEIFMHKNVKTAILVGQARGVILLTAAQSKISLREFTPLQIKQALTGYGRADKHQIQKMVKAMLKLSEIPKPDDAADALATAICCGQTHEISNFKI